MKAILICPSPANGLSVLADTRSVMTLPFLGESFICYWMTHLAERKYTEVRVITTDPKEILEECLGDGSRWGLKVEVHQELRDLKVAEARKRHRPAYETDWAPEPHDVIEADHFPGLQEVKAFTSSESWFSALHPAIPLVVANKRIGLREIAPGVWAGRKTRVAASAKLIGPCWLGDHVSIGKDAVIGPMAFLESGVVVESACAVTNSWVGPQTFIGSLVELKDSLAWGDLLINRKSGSHTTVPDPFLMAPLGQGNERREKKKRKAVEAAVSGPLARPFGAVISLAQKLQS